MPKSHSALRFVMFIFTHKSSALGKMAQCVFIVNYDVLTLLVVNTRYKINGPSVNNEEIKHLRTSYVTGACTEEY